MFSLENILLCPTKTVHVTGVISRIARYGLNNGDLQFELEEAPGVTYLLHVDAIDRLQMTQKGDRVEFNVKEGKVHAIAFSNHSMAPAVPLKKKTLASQLLKRP